MKKIVDYTKQYIGVISIVLALCILLTYSLSYFKVNTESKRAAEMYIGDLKYTISIDGTSTNTLTVPSGETIVDIDLTNQNEIKTYYKLLYLKNSNVSISYYNQTKNTSDELTSYKSPGDLVESKSVNNLKLKILNNSASSQTLTFKVSGGYSTNTLVDVEVPNTYTEITSLETPSTNTYFCKTNDTLTQGLEYVDGQYTYGYKKEGAYSSTTDLAWSNIFNNGWGVQLTDKASTDAVTDSVCTYINNVPVTSMAHMYYKSKTSSINLTNVNTSKVTSMRFMFTATQVTSLDLSNFDTNKVTDMFGIFQETQIEALDLSNFDTSNVTSMGQMFYTSKVKIVDLSNFNTEKVENMNFMFFRSQAEIIDLSNFVTSNVTSMSGMFRDSYAEVLDLRNFDTSNVINMAQMFLNSKATTIDLSSFDTSNVTSMSSMFRESYAEVLDLSNFDTSNVINMAQMFYDSKSTEIKGLENFNTEKVENMGSMFSGSKATILDVSNFNTSKVTNMSLMFSSSKAKSLDLSNFDTSKVTNMYQMFMNSSNLTTIYASDKFVTNKVTVADSANMFTGSTKLVGGAGTVYNSSYVDKTYARVDGGTSSPGYFTDIADKDISSPVSFSTDSWKTIINAVRKNNISKYNIGDVKEVDLGTYGKHNVRIANTTTPTACSTSGFSQTACGFVLEFADIITYHKMNDTDTNVGGWLATSMRTFVNNDIYNAIPSEIKNVIIDTTVVSGHGKSDTENFTSTDKLYLLAPKEIYTNFSSSYDTAKDLTRTLDYYTSIGVTTSNYSEAIKKNGISASIWWLRAATSSSTYSFLSVYDNGGWANDPASISRGVAPAFRLG